MTQFVFASFAGAARGVICCVTGVTDGRRSIRLQRRDRK
jgi:hypothetical protein